MSDDAKDVLAECALREKVTEERLSLFVDKIKEWEGCSGIAVLIDHKCPGGALAIAGLGLNEPAVLADCAARLERARAHRTGDALAEAEAEAARIRKNPALLVLDTVIHTLSSAAHTTREDNDADRRG